MWLVSCLQELEEVPSSGPYNWTEKALISLEGAGIKRVSEDGSEELTNVRLTADSETSTVFYLIMNYEGITLPNTGGAGTTLIYMIGMLLMAVGGLGLLIRRRTGLA